MPAVPSSLQLHRGRRQVTVAHMFKRCIVGSLFVVAAACGKKQEKAPPPPAPAPAPTSVVSAPPPVDASTTPPPVPDPENYVVVKPAFGGNVPTFPQLSADGATAAVDLSAVPLVTSRLASFEVGFLSDTGKLEHVAVLDIDTAAKLAANPATPVDAVALAKSASSITKRLADGKFSELATAINRGALEVLGGEARTQAKELPISIDKAKLVATVVVHESGPTSLKLRLDNEAGKKVAERVVPGVATTSGGSECRAAPRLGGVWFDTARKRMLLQISFMTAGECSAVRTTYQLWKLP
jgi:hypothetical protein